MHRSRHMLPSSSSHCPPSVVLHTVVFNNSLLALRISESHTARIGKRPKRLGLTGAPRYVETRVDGVFPAKKSRFRVVSGKDNAKKVHLWSKPTT
ncbi:hypothetical protein HN51_039154 [Arachis hypogaea]